MHHAENVFKNSIQIHLSDNVTLHDGAEALSVQENTQERLAATERKTNLLICMGNVVLS